MERAAVPSMIREERLKAWISNYSTAVLRTCYVWLKDRNMAEDAMQDTFLKAWKHMADFERKNIENEKAWLLRIAVNVCKDYRRSAWFRHVDRRQDADALLQYRAEETERDHALALDILRLPDQFRHVVTLYYYQGLSLKETAQALGVPLSTVHRRLNKAREMLKNDWLGGERNEG